MKKIKTIFLFAAIGFTTVANAGGGGANGSQSSGSTLPESSPVMQARVVKTQTVVITDASTPPVLTTTVKATQATESPKTITVNTTTNYSDKAALEAERTNTNPAQVKTLGQNAATPSKSNKGETSKQIQIPTLVPTTPVATKAVVTTPAFKATDANALAAERKNTKTIRTANPSMPNK